MNAHIAVILQCDMDSYQETGQRQPVAFIADKEGKTVGHIPLNRVEEMVTEMRRMATDDSPVCLSVEMPVLMIVNQPQPMNVASAYENLELR